MPSTHHRIHRAGVDRIRFKAKGKRGEDEMWVSQYRTLSTQGPYPYFFHDWQPLFCTYTKQLAVDLSVADAQENLRRYREYRIIKKAKHELQGVPIKAGATPGRPGAEPGGPGAGPSAAGSNA